MGDEIAHFVAGGLSGAIATTVTFPLEVIKTRLQSTVGQEALRPVVRWSVPTVNAAAVASDFVQVSHPRLVQQFRYTRQIVNTEGPQVLFRGLALSLFGSVPTRAIYFCAYSYFKKMYNGHLTKESSGVHLLSAMSAGIVTSTCTSPIYVIKTRIQLQKVPMVSAYMSTVRHLWSVDGFRGFYRGLSASYAGSLETAIYFVLYERMKKEAAKWFKVEHLHPAHCIYLAAGCKIMASPLCYPHEVVRTRLRQAVSPCRRKYHSFFQTLFRVWSEEGARGLYGGMTAHLIRVVPNSAIIFFSYESIVRILHYINSPNHSYSPQS